MNRKTLLKWKNRRTLECAQHNTKELDELGLDFLAWFDLLVSSVGDYLPHRDRVVIPFPKRILVLRKYREEAGEKRILSKSEFYRIWKLYRPKVKPRKPSSLLHCSTCTELDSRLLRGNAESRKVVRAEKKIHID